MVTTAEIFHFTELNYVTEVQRTWLLNYFSNDNANYHYLTVFWGIFFILDKFIAGTVIIFSYGDDFDDREVCRYSPARCYRMCAPSTDKGTMKGRWTWRILRGSECEIRISFLSV